ncbi:MAG: hypothetical protein R2752_15410 [Vicinamibacterales bacterium]
MLRLPTTAVVTWLAAGVLVVGQRDATQTFDAMPAGAPPPGFTFAAMRQASAGQWTVHRAGGHGWLTHAADPDSHGFAMAIAPVDPRRDVVAAVRLRLHGGARAGGLVWRYVDARHYYAALLDLRRGEISMYRVSDGNRIKLEFEDDLELDPDAWHGLKAVHVDDFVYVTLDGIRVFEDHVRRPDRTGPGAAGVLATGDSEVSFDDLRVEAPHARQ